MQVSRALAALTLTFGAALGLAACGDDTNDPTTADSSSESAATSASPTPDDPSSFAEVPGKPLTYQRSYEKFAVQLKPFDTESTPQFADEPADPGSKFLVVYTAIQPKLTDRGVERVRLDELWLRYEPVASNGCERVGTVETCFATNRMTVQPNDLSAPDWREDKWFTVEYSGVELKPGEQYVTALVFSLKDGVEAADGFQLCGNPDGSYVGDKGELPCIPLTLKS